MPARPHGLLTALFLGGCLLCSSHGLAQTCQGIPGPNIFPNGSFGSGPENVLPYDPAIAPGYAYTTVPPPVDGAYCLANNTVLWDWFAGLFWVKIGDHSPDSTGYMMVVNADYTPGIFYERTVEVCPNTPYVFTADIINLFLPEFDWAILPNVDFLVNGQVVYATGNIPMDEQWHEYGFYLVTGRDDTQMTLTLRNNAPGGFGNDLALDNISLRFCSPGFMLPEVVAICDSLAVLQPQVQTTLWQGAVYQWQISADNGATWADIPGATSQNFQTPNAADGQLYRLVMAGSTANLANGDCRTISNPARIEVVHHEYFLSETVCQGEAVQIGNQAFTVSGDFEVLLTADSDGCDSTVHLHLDVLPAATTPLSAYICAGEIFHFGNATITQSGTYTQLLTTWHGCDSLVTLQLEVGDFLESTFSTGICQGENWAFGNLICATPGDYVQVFTAANGCDSTVTLHLDVLPIFDQNLLAEICEGQAFKGNYFSQDTLLTDSLTAWQTGCDSIVHTQVKVWPAHHDSLAVFLCWGEVFDGTPRFPATEIVHAEYGWRGCDSLTTYLLTVDNQMVASIEGPAIICAPNVATLSAPGWSSCAWSNGATGPATSVSTAGEYRVTVTNVQGCTAQATFHLQVSDMKAEFETEPPRCHGDRNGSIRLFEPYGGLPPYQVWFQGNASDNELIFNDLNAGLYEIFVTDRVGCEWKHEFYLPDPPPFLLLPMHTDTLDLGETLELRSQATMPMMAWQWLPSEGLDCTSCPSPIASPQHTTEYHLQAWNAAGCLAESAMMLVVKKKRNVYVPNAFSPNGDGINDFFTLYPDQSVLKIKQLQIFDRWGDHVFSASDAAPNSAALQWDGQYRGQPAGISVYVWLAEVEYVDGVTEVLKGDVMLVR